MKKLNLIILLCCLLTTNFVSAKVSTLWPDSSAIVFNEIQVGDTVVFHRDTVLVEHILGAIDSVAGDYQVLVQSDTVGYDYSPVMYFNRDLELVHGQIRYLESEVFIDTTFLSPSAFVEYCYVPCERITYGVVLGKGVDDILFSERKSDSTLLSKQRPWITDSIHIKQLVGKSIEIHHTSYIDHVFSWDFSAQVREINNVYFQCPTVDLLSGGCSIPYRITDKPDTIPQYFFPDTRNWMPISYNDIFVLEIASYTAYLTTNKSEANLTAQFKEGCLLNPLNDLQDAITVDSLLKTVKKSDFTVIVNDEVMGGTIRNTNNIHSKVLGYVSRQNPDFLYKTSTDTIKIALDFFSSPYLKTSIDSIFDSVSIDWLPVMVKGLMVKEWNDLAIEDSVFVFFPSDLVVLDTLSLGAKNVSTSDEFNI